MSEVLREARKYEELAERMITEEERPRFHLSCRVGWMNDPNGFSCYQGKYHMFYQYHPYNIVWGPMHWGHAVSEDLLKWDYLPTALAPDELYDKDGCFSGSAVVLEDGRHLLMYTGVSKEGFLDERFSDGMRTEKQQQCLAVGDGIDYVKYPANPVITTDMLPEGCSLTDFRDPKMIRLADGSYQALLGSRPSDGSGQILLYQSKDAFHWEYKGILAKNLCRFGRMWECPDFFELDGKHVLLVSPQDMLPEGFEYHNGNGTLALIGHLAEDGSLCEEANQSIDYGIDFYAPQTVLTPDGRRVMIGWMQNWDPAPAMRGEKIKWLGQMTIPRELSIVDGRLYQKPVRELETHRQNKVAYENVLIEGEEESRTADSTDDTQSTDRTFPGMNGRCVDMLVRIRPEDGEKLFDRFTIKFAAAGSQFSMLNWRPKEQILKIDRKFSGSRRAIIHQRRALVPSEDGSISVRLILDRFSAEVFVNDGYQVLSLVLYTNQEADGIFFSCRGRARVDIEKYDLV